MRNILITGKIGLSSTVKEYLLSGGMNAECVDVFGDKWKEENFSGYDTLVHIAGVVPGVNTKTDDFYSVNTKKTVDIAKKAKADGIRHFVFLSSMAVYGVLQQMKVQDGTVGVNTICKPDSDYGKSKLLAENELREIEDETFSVAMIRVPSIYGKGKTDYIDQYKYLADKLPFIPVCFTDLKKSVICVENLCELIRLIVENNTFGIVCPDDGPFSAVDFCSAIYPQKRRSVLVGKIIELLLRKNSRIIDYYGAVCYSKEASNIFDGRYRCLGIQEAIGKIYSKEEKR